MIMAGNHVNNMADIVREKQKVKNIIFMIDNDEINELIFLTFSPHS